MSMRFLGWVIGFSASFVMIVAGISPASATAGDGVTWVAQSSIPVGEWRSVAYGNSTFVAVSPTGSYVMTSADGTSWTARTPAENNYWQSVTFGNSLFVAVASTGTNRVMTSPDGVTWTSHAATAAVAWHAVKYGNNTFVAVGDSGNVMTSPDGATWTAQTSAVPSYSWQRLAFGGGTFLALAPTVGSQTAMTSSDGITWTRQTFPDSASWYYVAYGNGVFVARTASGGYIATSPDGVTWTRRASGAANNAGVYFGNSTFVSLPAGQVQVSVNSGVTWTNYAASPNGLGYGTFAEGLFVVVATNSVMTSGTFSPQHVTWTPSNTSIRTNASPVTPSSSATRSPSDGGNITYSVTSAGTTGCVVNATSGELTVSAPGTCLVTATAAATPAYSEASTTVAFSISDPVGSSSPSSGGSTGTSASAASGGSLQTISELRPASGPRSGGNTIAVIGYGFTGATSVTIGGKPAEYRVVNDAHIEVIAPPGDDVGSADVAVNLTPERGRAFAPGGYVYSSDAPPSQEQPPSQSSATSTNRPKVGALESPVEARRLPRGFTVVSSADDSRVVVSIVRKPVDRLQSQAPRLALKPNHMSKFLVRGLPNSHSVVVEVGIGTKYFRLGRGTTTSTGTLTLPTISVSQKGEFRIRFIPTSGPTMFARLGVS